MINSNAVCRSCGSSHLEDVINLGLQPLANNLLKPGDDAAGEPRFPLEVCLCKDCWLLQITHIVPPVTLFSEYVYYSSFSDHMLRHAREASLRYIQENGLTSDSLVMEVASNDGYLLRNFVQAGIPCLGIEPAQNIAAVAVEQGIPTVCEFFGAATAARLLQEKGPADLILANNVFAHAPDTNDFVAGLQTLLKPAGRAVIEFPYAVDMVEKTEFDTIYHEHVFYFTLAPLIPLFARHGLEIFHAERIAIHGGSLRIFVGRQGAAEIQESVTRLLKDEEAKGVTSLDYYTAFASEAERVRRDLTVFFEDCLTGGSSVAAYGAAAKGNTLLNFIGPAAGHLQFIADRSQYKQGMLSPGLHIPIVDAGALVEKQPDFTVLLAWNFADEILSQQAAYRRAGGRFVIPLPHLKILEPLES